MAVSSFVFTGGAPVTAVGVVLVIASWRILVIAGPVLRGVGCSGGFPVSRSSRLQCGVAPAVVRTVVSGSSEQGSECVCRWCTLSRFGEIEFPVGGSKLARSLISRGPMRTVLLRCGSAAPVAVLSVRDSTGETNNIWSPVALASAAAMALPVTLATCLWILHL
jgi:hypothetical protein